MNFRHLITLAFLFFQSVSPLSSFACKLAFLGEGTSEQKADLTIDLAKLKAIGAKIIAKDTSSAARATFEGEFVGLSQEVMQKHSLSQDQLDAHLATPEQSVDTSSVVKPEPTKAAPTQDGPTEASLSEQEIQLIKAAQDKGQELTKAAPALLEWAVQNKKSEVVSGLLLGRCSAEQCKQLGRSGKLSGLYRFNGLTDQQIAAGLVDAIKNKDNKTVAAFLSSGTPVDENALKVSTSVGSSSMTQMILASSPAAGNEALKEALEKNNLSVIEFALRANFKIDSSNMRTFGKSYEHLSALLSIRPADAISSRVTIVLGALDVDNAASLALILPTFGSSIEEQLQFTFGITFNAWGLPAKAFDGKVSLLELAIMKQCPRSVDYLLSEGASTDKTPNNDLVSTTLYGAMAKSNVNHTQHITILKSLVLAGVDLSEIKKGLHQFLNGPLEQRSRYPADFQKYMAETPGEYDTWVNSFFVPFFSIIKDNK